MTSGDDELFVTVGGRDVGLEALLKKVDAEMQVSADRAVKLGQSYARLAQAQGSPTTASEILAGTMQRAGSASERSLIGLATQQANLGNSSRNLTSTIAGLGGQLSQLGGTAGGLAGSIGNLAGSFGTLGTVGAAIGLGKVAGDLAQAGANADLVRTRFDGLAESAHTTGDALIGALRAASGGEITDLSLELAANRAQILGVAHSAEEMSTLLAIARDRAQQLGTSSSKAFDDLVTGLGRGSPLILDNLGIMVSVKEANEQYARSLGKTASALTEAEQKQALINAVLAQGRASLEATGGAVESNAGKFARAGAALENIKNAVGSDLAGILAPIAGSFADIAGGVGRTSEEGARFAQAIQTMTGALTGLLPTTGAVQTANEQFANSLLQWIGIAPQAAGAAQQLHVALDEDRVAAGQAQQAQAQQAATLAQTGGAYNAYAAAANASGIATAQAAAQFAYAAQAQELAAGKAQLAAVNSQQLALVQNQLTQAAQTAANVILAGGGNIAATAARLAGSSSQVDVLTAAYLRLAAAQATATGQKLQNQTARQLIGADSDAAGIRSAKHDQVVADRAASVKASNEAASAERNYQQTLGNTAPALAHARAELAQLTAGSAAYINKQNEIAQLQKQDAKGAKGGGGGTKLSDQQTLQNSLLASQEDYEQKSEDATTQHAIDVEKINQDFYQKMRAAQRDFDQSQLDGRAGFYDQLGQIESDKIRQSASQQYEAASVEAGKIAQEKGADVAEKYMDAQESIISSRAKRLADIEKAEKDKDKGKAEYLRGVDAEYKKAEDAKLARIQEGGGSIASERQQQLDDAAQKEADAQDKIGLAADRAAEKKILASDRSGKQIDAEALKVSGLADQYDRLGASGARAGITPAAGAPGAATTGQAAPAGAAAAAPDAGDNPIVAALHAAADAIVGALASVERAERDTAGAVKRLTNTGNIAA